MSFDVVWNTSIWYATYDFLLVFYRNYVSIVYRFQDIITYLQKIIKGHMTLNTSHANTSTHHGQSAHHIWSAYFIHSTDTIASVPSTSITVLKVYTLKILVYSLKILKVFL